MTWNARIVEDWTARTVKVAIFRRNRDDSLDVVNADGTCTTHPPGVQPGEGDLIRIPWDALEPLRDAIEQRLGATANKATIDGLSAALAIERGRVDNVLASLLARPATQESETR